MKGSTKVDVLDLEAGPSLADLAALQYNTYMYAPPVRGAVESVTDLGELAARLGSIVTFDRRGDVVFMDNFECGLAKWVCTAIGSGCSSALSEESPYRGYWSAKLSVGSVAVAISRMDIYTPFPLPSKMGFEIAFTVDGDAGSFSLGMNIYNGTQLIKGEIRYTPSTGALEYIDVDSNLATLASGLSLRADAHQYHVIKLVLDGDGAEYVRVILDSTQYKMDGVAARSEASALDAYMQGVVSLISDGAHTSSIYVDGAIITQNEPISLLCRS